MPLKTTDIQFLKGIGEKRALLYNKLGIRSVADLLRFYPRVYEDWSAPCGIVDAPLNQRVCIRAQVIRPAREIFIRKGMTLYKAIVTDGIADLTITLFNTKFAAQQLKEGEEYIFSGSITQNSGRKEMSSPEFAPAATGQRIVPIYPQTDGLNSRHIEGSVAQALQMLPENLKDPLPDSLRMEYGLCHLRYAIENIHRPTSEEALQIARHRLAFEELLVLQLGMFHLKSRARTENLLVLERDASEEFYRLLPFTPTNAQKRAVADGISDMMGKTPMNRLVQGDVGSGKTAVAAALCYSAIQNGWQCAMMAPTEILAQQHYHSMCELLKDTLVQCALLTGSTPAAAKKKIYTQLRAGEIHFVIGTHALISEQVEFYNLGLVITDEQHRFGVEQRAALTNKGNRPHLLVMSATPIPRTLALMIYGDLDVSVLDELPPGRQKIDTYVVDTQKRDRVYQYIRKHLDEGRQAYVVCPLVEEGDGELVSAEKYAEELAKEEFSAYRVGLLHGKMKPSKKEEVMAGFSRGEIQLLVSTTVIEVGVDVPNAVLMVIENAERFGLSQLHQLRGRVGRGKFKSNCILISDAQNEEAVRRLGVMAETGDGFRIAEEDLKLRGPGDFFGSRQHGLPELKVADMINDMETLHQAQRAAKALLAADPELKLPEHRGLALETQGLFQRVGEQGLN